MASNNPSYDAASKTIMINPANPLGALTTYRVTLSTGISGIDSKPLASAYTWTFTTGSS